MTRHTPVPTFRVFVAIAGLFAFLRLPVAPLPVYPTYHGYRIDVGR